MSANPSPAIDVRAALSAELDSGTLDVPLLPQVASEVLSSTLDDQANAQHLAELIEKDQGLASHIMRVVNSPGFRGSAEIVSLKQAIARLGMERIREIALTISLKSTLFKPGGFDDLVQGAWEFGLETALWAKEVARIGRKNVEIAYLCGLLHNVGVPILVNRISELDPNVERSDVEAITEELTPRAGAVLINQWHLPSVVAACIESLGEGAQTPELASDLDALRVVEAGRLVASLHGQSEEEGNELVPATLVENAAFQYLNFYPDDAEDLLGKAEQLQTVMEGMR